MVEQREVEGTAPPVPQIDASRCTGCGLCVTVCPTGALAMQGRVAVVSRADRCEYRGECERICPTFAITRPFKFILEADAARERNQQATTGGV